MASQSEIGLPLISMDHKTNTGGKDTEKSVDNENDVTDGPIDATVEKIEQATAVPENFNSYRYKKTLTQGLMDISLFSANANQLRSMLEYGSSSSALSIIISSLIILSLILQVGVGIMLLLSIRFNVEEKRDRQKVYEYGNHTAIAIFLITAINIFIVAFGGPGTIDAMTFSPMNTTLRLTNNVTS